MKPDNREDGCYAYEWIVENPEWWPLYRDPRWSNDVSFSIPGYSIPDDLDLEAQHWCMEHCRGRWATRAYEFGGPVYFRFEDDDDAVRFRLSFETMAGDET